MPKKGYVSVTVSEEVYQMLQKRAEQENRTVPGLIKNLLENSKEA